MAPAQRAAPLVAQEHAVRVDVRAAAPAPCDIVGGGWVGALLRRLAEGRERLDGAAEGHADVIDHRARVWEGIDGEGEHGRGRANAKISRTCVAPREKSLYSLVPRERVVQRTLRGNRNTSAPFLYYSLWYGYPVGK